jgi:hypothetical protein
VRSPDGSGELHEVVPVAGTSTCVADEKLDPSHHSEAEVSSIATSTLATPLVASDADPEI